MAGSEDEDEYEDSHEDDEQEKDYDDAGENGSFPEAADDEAESYWSSKLRNMASQRREARDELVDNVRRYGMVLLGAVVLLPPQLVALAVLGITLVYMCMTWGGRRRPKHESSTG